MSDYEVNGGAFGLDTFRQPCSVFIRARGGNIMNYVMTTAIVFGGTCLAIAASAKDYVADDQGIIEDLNVQVTPGERVHVTRTLEERDLANAQIVTTDLGHRTYVLGDGEGGGSNIVVAVTDDGVVMIDTKFAQLHDKIKAAVAALTDQPVRYVINTIHRNDHTNGNALFAKEGVTIIAHENVGKNMLAANPMVDPAALPTETYKDARTLQLGGRTIELRHPAVPATVDSGTYIHFRDANVLVGGGDFFYSRQGLPNVSGSIDGQITAMDELIAIADDDTKVVPNHGPVSDKASMIAFRDMLVTARAEVATLIAEGKTVDEAIMAKPLAVIQTRWDVVDERTDDAQAARLTRAVYESLTAGAPAR